LSDNSDTKFRAIFNSTNRELYNKTQPELSVYIKILKEAKKQNPS
jgi:hypothetical protein